MSETQNFHEDPIVLKTLETTGALAGDDSGYRDTPPEDTGEEMVNIGGEVMTRPSYDGIDEVTGKFDSKLVLPAGLEQGGVWARRSVLEALKAANNYLQRYGMQVGVVDAFRSQGRQAAGFARKAVEILDGNINPNISTLYKAGTKADGTFSNVRPFRDNPVYVQFRKDMAASKEVIQLAQEEGKDPEDVATDLADICANLRKASEVFGDKVKVPTTPLNMDVPLNSNNNAHAGGGAVDAFLYDTNGKLLNGHVPFDYPGFEASMDFLEQEGSRDEYNKRANEKPALRAHLDKMGITGDVSEAQWKTWQEAQRIMFHVMTRTGATFFTDTAANRHSNGFFVGENWHFEPGNIVRNPETGEVVYQGAAAETRKGGNPGNTLQTQGPGVPAPWGGDAAHQQLRGKGVLKG